MYHVVLALLIATTSFGCAYNYAGQEGKNRQRRPDPDNVEVVSVEQKEEQSDAATEDLPTEPVEPDASPCGVDVFVVQQFAADGLIRKSIACGESRVVNVERVPMSDSAYQRMKDAGYPVGKWYIVVDPDSVRDTVINNEDLIQMSREYELDYFGRETTEGNLIYLFLSPVP